LLGEEGIEKLRDFVLHRPVFGTCAGCILLAREVENPEQRGLGAIDIRVRRNAYGRQIDSFIAKAATKLGEIEMVFIRAPKIVEVGPQVDVLASEKGDPVLVQQGSVMAATFHPELSEDTAVHKRFLKMVEQATTVRS
jgi:pyridoxal 5'-phosphate synthase pdxT subunit